MHNETSSLFDSSQDDIKILMPITVNQQQPKGQEIALSLYGSCSSNNDSNDVERISILSCHHNHENNNGLVCNDIHHDNHNIVDNDKTKEYHNGTMISGMLLVCCWFLGCLFVLICFSSLLVVILAFFLIFLIGNILFLKK